VIIVVYDCLLYYIITYINQQTLKNVLYEKRSRGAESGANLPIEVLPNSINIAASKQFHCDFSKDGSFILCILAELKEMESGLVFVNRGKNVPLSAMVDAFSGENCVQLAGKPKIFIFLDQAMKTDSLKTTDQQVHFFLNFVDLIF